MNDLFFINADVVKSTGERITEPDGLDYENMYLEGIASTPDKDVEGEILKPISFDLSYVLPNGEGFKKGKVNWNHNQTEVIGEFVDAKVLDDIQPYNKKFANQIIKKGDLWVRVRLLNSSENARKYYKNAYEMQADSNSNVRMSFSVEGKRVFDSEGKLKSVLITGLALTNTPINHKRTFAEVVKSLESENDEFVEKTQTEIVAERFGMSASEYIDTFTYLIEKGLQDVENCNMVIGFIKENNFSDVKKAIEIAKIENETLKKGVFSVLKSYPNLDVLNGSYLAEITNKFNLGVDEVIDFVEDRMNKENSESVAIQKAFVFYQLRKKVGFENDKMLNNVYSQYCIRKGLI